MRILVGTVDVATLTHFPRILPPIMKCVALAEAPFCSKKVYSWSLPAAGPSSNVSYIAASARSSHVDIKNRTHVCLQGVGGVGSSQGSTTHRENSIWGVEQVVRRRASVGERADGGVGARLAVRIGRITVVLRRGLDVGQADRGELGEPCGGDG